LDWNASTFWWVAGGVMVAAELATGTFYLLMLALGCAAAALAALGGLPLTAQMIAAALVGGGATVAWHLKRQRQPAAAPADRNPDVNMDIGQTVEVSAWDAEGRTRVQYRGAGWAARLADGAPAAPGPHVIVAVHGTELHVAPAAPRAH
jgi:membrane protein implicated in regulation of membrane protease activity